MINKVDIFSIYGFDDWRNRKKDHLLAMHEEIIFVIQEGPIWIVKVNTAAKMEDKAFTEMLDKPGEQ